MDEKVYEHNARAAEEKLRPLLTDEFLAALVLAVKTCGWTVDHVESASFVNWCFDLAEKPKADLEPFDYEQGK